jgi:hypothetical protein
MNYPAANSGPKVTKNWDLQRRKRRGIRPVEAVPTVFLEIYFLKKTSVMFLLPRNEVEAC